MPKFRLAVPALRLPGVAPVPESGTLSDAFEALLVTVSELLAAPEAVGANITLKLTFWPAFTVAGRVKPATL